MLELVFQASSRLWNPLVTEGSITELNPLSHTHRNSLKCREYENKMQNELSIAAGYHLITKSPNIELNPLSYTHKYLPKCWQKEKNMRNEPSVGIGASSIQPTLEPPCY